MSPTSEDVGHPGPSPSGISASGEQAIRVTFTNMPQPYEDWNGLTMWVGQPQTYCENSGQREPPAEGCGSAPGLSREFLASTLQCEPYYADWSQFETVHVFHEAIIPGGTYETQSINSACSAASETNYSAPLAMITSRWGDVVKDCSQIPCLPPDDSVDVTTDVTAILDKFKNSRNALITARADIEPQVPDQKINISDVTFALDAFRGRSYPPGSFPPPSPRPCQ